MGIQGNIVVYVIAGCFVSVGIATAIIFISKARKAFASRYWPSTHGELLSNQTRLVVYDGREPDGGADLASALVTDFRYTYCVKGRRYHGKRVTFSDHVNKFTSSVRTLQNKFADKETIEVYYNPENPEESVLVPGPSLYNFTPMITSLLFVAAGIFLINWNF